MTCVESSRPTVDRGPGHFVTNFYVFQWFYKAKRVFLAVHASLRSLDNVSGPGFLAFYWSAGFGKFLQVLTLASHWLEDCENFSPTPEENDRYSTNHYWCNTSSRSVQFVPKGSGHIGQGRIDKGTYRPKGRPRDSSTKGRFIQKTHCQRNGRSETFRSGTHGQGRNNKAPLSLSLFKQLSEKRVLKFISMWYLQLCVNFSTVRNKCDWEIEYNEKSAVYICNEKLLQLHFCGAILFNGYIVAGIMGLYLEIIVWIAGPVTHNGTVSILFLFSVEEWML